MITRNLFSADELGEYNYQNAKKAYAAGFRLREPSCTFRFTVATTF